MSYILDALRRAEAERQRGAVPGLHTQPTVVALESKAPLLRLLAMVAAAAGALGAAAGVAWWLGRQAAPAARDVPVAAAPEVKPAAAPAVAPAPSPAPAAVPAPVTPQVVVMVNPPPAAAPVIRAASAAVVAAAPSVASAPVAPPRFAELPESVRASMPPLALGGIVHASAAAQRLVILGGQVFHEGDRPLPDLLVQEIRPRTVVLVWRGQAFEFGP